MTPVGAGPSPWTVGASFRAYTFGRISAVHPRRDCRRPRHHHAEITPIGTVRNNRTDVQHTDNRGAVRSTITIDERFGEACLQGLEGFSLPSSPSTAAN
ncbi:hypothetical protein FHS34_007446 [Streptomyces echinatus]|uniref:TsaA-like domain-containing protein n=1 Tax=Streptomyces echinatus TaxID=67293 RepID=A0A7W9UUT5_9ACTN|nr:hypothetical protein [Streptomyces echinatus]